MSEILTVELKEFDTASLTGSYQNFGSVTGGPVYKIQFINVSDVDCYVTEGASVWRVPASGTITLDETNAVNVRDSSRVFIDNGGQLQIKQVTGAGTGYIWAHLVRVR